jgi:hypothetical protein
MNKNDVTNTGFEDYDLKTNEEQMPQEEILMKEHDILAGILEAGRGRDNADNYRKIQIKRAGKLLFEFRIRPLTEEDQQNCARSATTYAPTKQGQPKKALDTNRAMFRSLLIYTATVDEDRAKVWDNPKAKNALNVLDSTDMIDMILKAGEKSAVIAIIDEISGYTDETEEIAKN